MEAGFRDEIAEGASDGGRTVDDGRHVEAFSALNKLTPVILSETFQRTAMSRLRLGRTTRSLTVPAGLDGDPPSRPVRQPPPWRNDTNILTGPLPPATNPRDLVECIRKGRGSGLLPTPNTG
jgi:hypothetical protein